jgi:hypothetical protein
MPAAFLLLTRFLLPDAQANAHALQLGQHVCQSLITQHGSFKREAEVEKQSLRRQSTPQNELICEPNLHSQF